MQFDPQHYPYHSKRTVTYAQKGMVATTQPLAAEAGLQMLKLGGNAVDAAIATAACLTVLEPNSNSIGGDAFAIVWMDGNIYGLNASGPAPQALSIEAVKQAGYDHIPDLGVVPVMVPGTPAAWAALSKRFGKLKMTEVLAPAIEYAESGFPLSPTVAAFWSLFAAKHKQLNEPLFEPWRKLYMPNGQTPQAGEMWRSPDHAVTLRRIAKTNAEAFYRGEIAEQIDAHFQRQGGFLTAADLAAYEPEWVTPIKVPYRGYDVWEIPPNGLGLVALMALNILSGYDLNSCTEAEAMHLQIEAVKLAYADGLQYITDPSAMQQSVEKMLSKAYVDERRRLIGKQAKVHTAGKPDSSDTIYLAAGDKDGNMVSFIQSHFSDFGSAVVVPGTGICMQNRGRSFSLDPYHDNALAPGKRTRHTIIPGFLTKDGEAIGPFGVMGGTMQPQGHVQVVSQLLDFQQNPQSALDAPRWRWEHGKTVLVERGCPDHIVQKLIRQGHDIRYSAERGNFGRGQLIIRDINSGVMAGGTEPRADGSIAVW